MISTTKAAENVRWAHEIGQFVDGDGTPIRPDEMQLRYSQLQLAFAALKEEYEVERKKWREAAEEAAAGTGPGAGIWDLIRRMRAAQKEYFATRDKASLSESKRLERELDRIIQARRNDERAGQQVLGLEG